MFRKIFCSILALIPIAVQPALEAEIIAITQIEDIVPAVEQDSLVLFNIAEVLLDSEVSLGTSRWRKYIKLVSPWWKANPGINVHDRLTLLTARRVPHKCVEEATPKLIDQWQQNGIAVMALTSRGKSEWYDTPVEGVDVLTEKMLKNVGIDFSLTQLPEEFAGLKDTFGESYGRGILYATHFDKDELLTAILSQTHYRPGKIVFVDDKRDSLEAMDAAMKKLGIPFVGYWYRRTVEDHLDFNPMIAHIQLEALLSKDVLLTDAEAEAEAQIPRDIDPEASNVEALYPELYFITLLNRIDWSKVSPN